MADTNFYVKDSKVYCNKYMEIYIPTDYFANKFAANLGYCVESIGLVYASFSENGKGSKISLVNLPAIVQFNLYDSEDSVVDINGAKMEVTILKYLKDSFVMRESLTQGRLVGELFLKMILNGKIPKHIQYSSIIDAWWKNMEIAGIKYNVPSKIFEMIISEIYRDAKDTKSRYASTYGRTTPPDEHAYKAMNVRGVVQELSTFSGMVFEDIGRMTTSGINNSLDGIEEEVSPMEKIMRY